MNSRGGGAFSCSEIAFLLIICSCQSRKFENGVFCLLQKYYFLVSICSEKEHLQARGDGIFSGVPNGLWAAIFPSLPLRFWTNPGCRFPGCGGITLSRSHWSRHQIFRKICSPPYSVTLVIFPPPVNFSPPKFSKFCRSKVSQVGLK